MIYHHYADKGGLRFVVLFHEGRKHVKLFDTGTFDVYTITPRDVKRLKPYTSIKAKTLAIRIRKRRAIFKRCGLSFPKNTVSKVIALLEGAT